MKITRLRRVGAVAIAAVSVALAPVVLPAITLSSGAGAAEQDLGVDDPYETVSADPLPAPSVNGVVWDQEVVGNTVYAVGEFTTATTPGGNPVTRNNALAYDITTGALLDWAPSANAVVRTVSATPDGASVFIGGVFEYVNGQRVDHIASVDPRSGAVRPINLHLNSGVNDIAISSDGSKLYAGGYFTAANNQERQRILEFDLNRGSLTSFRASVPNYYVHAVATEPGGSGVVIGGAFTKVNGSTNPGKGIAILEAGSGQLRNNRVASVIGASGSRAAVWGLSADSRGIYPAMYSQSGTFEGVARLNWRSGELEWMLDCHGDSYDTFPSGDVVYISSHEHDCSNVGQFPNDWHIYHNGTAVQNQAVGTVGRNTYRGYTDFQGQPATKLLSFFPRFTAGTYTGAHQATWTVEGNQDYVVYGGEFTAINGMQQQGLVRFAKRSIAPNQVSAENKGGAYKFSATSPSAGVISFNWTANWDRDDRMLTYEIFRDNMNGKPVWTRKVASTFWDLPQLTATDFVDPGTEHRYRIRVSDKHGAKTQTDWLTVTAKNGVGFNAQARAAAVDGASNVWSMDETDGSTVKDSLGNADGRLSGWTWQRGGKPAVKEGRSVSLGGSSYMVAQRRVSAPKTFSEELWFRTTTRSGGTLMGFGSSTGASSSNQDLMLYMRDNGTLVYSIYDRDFRTITSSQPVNDGKWHHVVATTSDSGSVLYVDGQVAAQDASMTKAQNFKGYWHVGGETLRGWPGRPSSKYFDGDIDEAAVYSTALSADQVVNHYSLGADVAPANRAPVAALTVTPADLAVTADASAAKDEDGKIASYKWNWGDKTAEETTTAATATHTYAAAGTYTVRVTVTDNAGATASAEQAVTVKAAAKPAQPENQAQPAQPGDVAFLASFNKDVASGWGSADKGGDWKASWGGSALSVSGGAGNMTLARGGYGSRVVSSPLAKADADLTSSFKIDALPDAGKLYLDQDVRVSDAGAYRVKLQVRSDGTGKLELLKLIGGTEYWLKETQLPKVNAGETIHLRLSAIGTSTTKVNARIWTGDAEPKEWNVSYEDSVNPMTAPGGVAVTGYLGSSTIPVTIAVDEMAVK
ncbi:LamG-like jellyroll fold domain-containing protein [Actinomyces bovis]|uniref:LamG-like jellyroll fold domain-containing protein n=1 Tax=Actinomyces bovis TaxID=1658 RepID=UPI00147555FC|nr:LamG-like jellyroll fold domain-containing protein [Actinomyces bovis]